MAQCAQSAQEFIQNAFGPMVAVLCSHDAEVLCQKNNLTFVEMVRPFCKLTTEAHIRDPAGQVHSVRNLRIIVNEMNMQPPSPTIARKITNEAVSNAQLPQVAEGNRTNVLSVGNYDLQISPSTPWFEAYRDSFLHTVQIPSDHEFLKHFVACMLVVSTSHADPMDQFIKLSQQQNQHQFNSKTSYPKWFNNNIFKYYVLLHDQVEGDEEQAEGLYKSMKNSFGTHACYLLKINSRPLHTTETAAFTSEQGSLPDPWSQFINKKIDDKEQSDMDLTGTSLTEGPSQTEAFPGKVSEGEPEPAMNSSQSVSSLTRVESEPVFGRPEREEASLIRVESAIEMAASDVDNIDDNSVSAGMPPQVENKEVLPPQSTQPTSATTPTQVFTHPLSPENEDGGRSGSIDELTPPPPTSATQTTAPNVSMMNKLNQRPPSNKPIDGHGACLTPNDRDRLRVFIHEFTVKGLLGYMERQIRILSEQLQSRKGFQRSLFSATKRFFGGSKQGSQSAQTQSSAGVKYPLESPELQMRRLADLAFLVQNYDLAYQSYHSAKREYNNDNAWMYFAGALEMAAVSLFMQSNPQKAFPTHYMESAITTYQGTCKNAQFATRATLLSTEALKARSMYADAAMQFIRMTSEDSDLRSAVLLEQAAHCFINMKQPMVRKYAFHMILSGHRYSKAGQRKHALRSYSQALQVYKGKGWTLAEDHINFTIGRQSFNLKQLDNATAAFKHLLTNDSRQTPPQQAAFLREYLFVFKQQLISAANEGLQVGILPQLPLPVIDKTATQVLLGSAIRVQLPAGKVFASSVNFDQTFRPEDVEKWKDLEDIAVKVSSKQNSLPYNYRPTVQLFSQQTNNGYNPVAVIGESITLEVKFVNPLKIPLVLTDMTIIWKFLPMKYLVENDENPGQQPAMISNEGDSGVKMSLADTVVETQIIPTFILNGNENKIVQLTVTPHQTGEMHIMGVAYSLGTTPPTNTQQAVMDSNRDSQSNNPLQSKNMAKKPSYVSGISVKGRQDLDVQGPRLNTSKTERAGIVYGPDRRLDPIIAPPMPLLQVIFSNFPTSMLCGEVQQITVEFTNIGKCALSKLCVSSKNPEFFTFGLITDLKEATQHVYRTVPKDEQERAYRCSVSELSCVTEIALPDRVLPPGASVSLPMWLRGPETSGRHEVNLLFYYEPVEENDIMRHRVLRHSVVLDTSNSISLRTTAKRGSSSQPNCQTTDDTLLVSLEVENMNQVHDATITEFSIEQVSCVSKQWLLTHLSTSRKSDVKINPREGCLMCLKAQKCKAVQGDFGEEVLFTNVVFSQDQEIDSSRTPCSDFYFWSKGLPPSALSLFTKSSASTPKDILTPDTDTDTSFSMEDSKAKLESAVDVGMTLIVLWKAFVVGDDGNCSVICGQHHVPISVIEQLESSQPLSKPLEQQPPIKFIKQVETYRDEEPSVQTLSQLVQYSLEFTQTINHFFQKSRLCLLPVKLHLHNCCQVKLEVVVNLQNNNPYDSYGADLSNTEAANYYSNNSPASSTDFSWISHTSFNVEIPAQQNLTVQLRACVCKPGLFNLSHISVCVVKPKIVVGGRGKRQSSQDLLDWDMPTEEESPQLIRQRQDGPYLVTVNDALS
ncbi:trafficking protein particle complex subunit 8-like [Ptychodera flava]|uniref:trafficking protein particle complex subunit 8-like n=1 Tax=Ptychodera flava TaxID=63121 RepID=UPI00396A84C9